MLIAPRCLPKLGRVTDFSGIPDTPQSSDVALLQALAADLTALDYSVTGVEQHLGEAAYAALGRDQLVPALLATEGNNSPLNVLIRLWLLAEPVAAEALAAALPRTEVNGLLSMGLVESARSGGDGDNSGNHGRAFLQASVDLRPYSWSDESGTAELWVASDLAAHQRPGVLRKDHVLGIGQASLTLAQSIVRRKVSRALDLGTGCGIQAFHLLRHADHVTLTDISARALAFTRFNLLLNADVLRLDPQQLDGRVRLLQGNLLEPVADSRFDLVVSNPPFVITPRRAGESAADQFTYRDGGMVGDDLVATLVRTLPEVLAPGGTAQMLGNWEQRDLPDGGEARTSAHDDGGEDLAPDVDPQADEFSRPRGWVAEGVDAWFIQRELADPHLYAETWLQDASESRDRSAYVSQYGAYLEDFAARSVSAIGFGLIWLRRPESGKDRTLFRFEEITHPIEQPIGPHLAAAVERADWLTAAKAAGNFDAAHLVVAEDVTEERHARPGAEHPGVILLRQGAGLRRTNLMSTELAGFVSACDGELSASQIAGALAALLGHDEDPRQSLEFTGQLLQEVGNLVTDGFLLPGGAN
jgi:methylase of polypeptide subunit release factors